MKRVHAFLDRTLDAIASLTGALGEGVWLDAGVLDRRDDLALATPGLVSANGSCRLIQTRDGWIAANLPRACDLDDVPALLGGMATGDPWQMLIEAARTQSANDLIARAEVLGLALAKTDETLAPTAPCDVKATGTSRRGRLRVVDLSSLWAGPLCGGVFARMGADVIKIEDAARPDTTAISSPLLDQRLNGAKVRKALPLATALGQAALRDDVARADVIITSARAQGLERLGLTRDRVFAANPSPLWIAITGHGWDSNRVAFGDDAAAAGGLLTWRDRQPNFMGDAIGDPLTGLAAAAAALELLASGRTGFIDAALARVSAYVAGAPI